MSNHQNINTKYKTMTKKYDLHKIREARNEFEAMLRIKGISARTFAKLLGVAEITSAKYISDPTLLRYSHMDSIAIYCNMSVKDIVDLIEYDLVSDAERFD
jgi:hypothetical protein